MKLADSLDIRDYVVTFKNLLSQDTCTQLMNWLTTLPEAENAWDGWEVAKSATGHDKQEITEHRTCHFTMLNEHRAPNFANLEMALHHVNEKYPFQHNSHSHTGIQVLRYQQGHKFREHIDHYSGGPRILSVSILLNDDYEGGQFSFWQGRHSAERFNEAGDALVFPSGLSFPHQVEPITRGTRYSMVIWTQ
jgi:predicted 2-oxoglutarate/Fe(II)-dependent dioxygenase YbiX